MVAWPCAWGQRWARGAVLAAGGCAFVLAPPCSAAGFSGGVGLASDKVSRGLSQNRGQASLLADLSWQTDQGWALGLGFATLHDNGRGTRGEASLALSRRWQLDADWSTQLTATHYRYPGSNDPRYLAYSEGGATVAWREALTLAVMVAPSISGTGQDRQWVRDRTSAFELGWHQPIVGRWSVDAGAGWHDTRRIGGTPYAYGSLGLSWGLGPVSVFVSRITSNADSRGGVPKALAGDRTLASVWWSF